MIEHFIFELGCSNKQWKISVKMRGNHAAGSYLIHNVVYSETRHFSVVEGRATAGKPYWNARHDVTERQWSSLFAAVLKADPYVYTIS